jgi:hypothetical protein
MNSIDIAENQRHTPQHTPDDIELEAVDEKAAVVGAQHYSEQQQQHPRAEEEKESMSGQKNNHPATSTGSEVKIKGHMSSYMYFADSVRKGEICLQNQRIFETTLTFGFLWKAFKQSHPLAGLAEIAKLTGAKWREMTEEQKSPYVKLAVDDKARHDRMVR